MSLTEREKQTRMGYDVRAKEWLERSGGANRPGFWPEEMRLFIQNLQGNKTVLEVGCGPATDAKFLERAGANVYSTDYSNSMLDLARQLNPKAVLAKMDMQSLGFKDNTFDGFWATACLLHLERPDRALRELIRVTKRGGVGFITVKEGEGEAVDPKMGFYYRYHKNPDFLNKLSYMGIETILTGRKEGTPNHDWLTYLVKVEK
jgi:ubiquinone/menaquinone biosynthesis C-methylase UbiE